MRVPCASVLQSYWDEEESFRWAFIRWAEQLTSGYDAWAARSFDEDVDIDLAKLRDILAAPQRERLDKVRGLRALLRPHHGNGVTLRRLAELTDLPLRLVVSCVYGTNVTHPERLADLEEDLLANGVPNGMCALQRKHGFSGKNTHTVKNIAKCHGIDLTPKVAYPMAMRNAAVRLMCDEHVAPADVGVLLAHDFPKITEIPLSTLVVWRRNAKTRGQKVSA